MHSNRDNRSWLWETVRSAASFLGVRDRVNVAIRNRQASEDESGFESFRKTFDRDRVAAEITAVIFTVDPSHLFERCLKSVNDQTLKPAKIEIVKDVCPFSKASQEGLDRVNTPFYISVDDDMVLYPSCFERLYYVMQSTAKCAEALAKLNDPLMGDITGIRMYRTDVVRPIGFHPLNDEKGAEHKMFHALQDAGYTSRNCHVVEGQHHPTYLPHEAFWKFRFSGEKARFYDDKYSPHFADMVEMLLQRWHSDRDEIALYALAGLFEGIKCEEFRGELTYEGRMSDAAFINIKAFVEMLGRTQR